MQRIEIIQDTGATAGSVWDVLSDVEGWASWGPWDDSEYERKGTTHPAGVGSIRRLQIGRRVLREETTEFDPELAETAYTVLSGIPVRDYEGRFKISRVGSKTRITWTGQFTGSLPGLGPLIRRSLTPKVEDIVERLARAAEASER
jgi:hypothetical protein